MQVKREEFIKVLEDVRPGLGSNASVEQYKSFVFKSGKVIAFNEDVFVSRDFDIDFEGAVLAKELYDVLKKMKDDKVTVTLRKGELLVQGKNTTSGIRVQSEIKLPQAMLKDTKKWTKLDKDFIEAVNFVSVSTTRNVEHPILGAIHFHENHLESTDRFRVTRYTLPSEYPEMLVSASVLRALGDYKPVEYNCTSPWLRFKNEAGVVYSVRLLAGEFVNVDALCAFKGKSVKLPENMDAILDRAKVFSMGKSLESTDVSFYFEKNLVTIKSRNENGWFEEAITIDYDGVPVAFQASPDFFKTMLKHLNSMELVTNGDKQKGLPENAGAVVFRGDNFIYSFSTVVI